MSELERATRKKRRSFRDDDVSVDSFDITRSQSAFSVLSHKSEASSFDPNDARFLQTSSDALSTLVATKICEGTSPVDFTTTKYNVAPNAMEVIVRKYGKRKISPRLLLKIEKTQNVRLERIWKSYLFHDHRELFEVYETERLRPEDPNNTLNAADSYRTVYKRAFRATNREKKARVEAATRLVEERRTERLARRRIKIVKMKR